MRDSLRIGLDIAPLAYPPSGVRTYVEALIAAFRNRDSGIDVVPLVTPGGLLRRSNRLARLKWDLFDVAQAADEAGVDLLHMTRFAAPARFRRPAVVTVHDLIPVQIPEYRASMPARVLADVMSRTIPRASRIIVPSAFVATAVQEILKIERDRIDVIPMGVDMPSDSGTPPFVCGPYLLHAGGFDVRKNLPALLAAFATARRQLGGEWRLVLLGAAHTGNPVVYPPIRPIIEQYGLTDCVVLTGRVNEREKQALYRHARIVVAPSLSEGFGLPILEAMAHGVPVVASNRTSHPEVTGEAGMLVEPDAASLAAAIVDLAGNVELAEELSRRGLERAAAFPWSRTAQLTAETYRRALSA
ncbi:MAG: glycosyltransferase family 4 protein [Thermomicrobiales bacterium]|nr:glycosyltransferase family 4 protein [Thermomicrobiales bacterium]MCO5221009.1 glycosyltransferase family 4 protein [Thermomicrobiales bacterium]